MIIFSWNSTSLTQSWISRAQQNRVESREHYIYANLIGDDVRILYHSYDWFICEFLYEHSATQTLTISSGMIRHTFRFLFDTRHKPIIIDYWLASHFSVVQLINKYWKYACALVLCTDQYLFIVLHFELQPSSLFELRREIWHFWKITPIFCTLFWWFHGQYTNMFEYLRHNSTHETYTKSNRWQYDLKILSKSNKAAYDSTLREKCEFLLRTSLVTIGSYLKSNFVILTNCDKRKNVRSIYHLLCGYTTKWIIYPLKWHSAVEWVEHTCLRGINLRTTLESILKLNLCSPFTFYIDFCDGKYVETLIRVAFDTKWFHS